MITRRLSLLSMLAGLMAVMFAVSGASAAQDDEKSSGGKRPSGKPPVGTWFVYSCPGSSDPCSTASPVVNLVSFTKDGITMSADFSANHITTSSGLGVWGKTGPNEFATTYVEFLSDADATAPLVSRAKIRGTLKYDRKTDTLAGPFRVDVTDPSGQNSHFEGTVLFTRMHLEPLP